MKNVGVIVKLFLITILLTVFGYSSERSFEDIKNVALNWAYMNNKSVNYSVGNESELAYKTKNNYVVVKLKPKGWVIVSTDDIAKPILGYSLDSNFEGNNTPPAYKMWVDAFNKEIENAKKSKKKVKEDFKKEWNKLAVDPEVFKDNMINKKVSYSLVGPLLKNINFGQEYPYNAFTPRTDDGRKTVVGCVATAFVQIMAYHKWPDRGVGSYSYTLNNDYFNHRRISANFNRTYNWTNMSNYDKAIISRDVGIANDMSYGPEGSGTWPKVANMRYHFKYYMSNMLQKSKYAISTWRAKIILNIARNLPINYLGFYYKNGKYYGHSFVLDGYYINGSNRYYHFNWGWYGHYNGWFTLEATGSHSNPFPLYQYAIFDIKPKGQTLRLATLSTPSIKYPITSSSVTFGWNKNSASKIKLLVRDLTSHKIIYNGYQTGSRKTVNGVSLNNHKIRVILYSYDSHNKYYGYKYYTYNTKKLKKAELKYPSTKQIINKQIVTFEWKKGNANKVKLYIRDLTSNKTLYKGYQTGIRKTISGISTNNHRIRVILYSYDSNNHYYGYKYYDYRTGEKAELISPRTSDSLSSTVTFEWRKNSASKVKLYIRDLTSGAKIYRGYQTGVRKTISGIPLEHRIRVILYSYDDRNKYLGFRYYDYN